MSINEVRDVQGGSLTLLKNRLVENKGQYSFKWSVTFVALRKAVKHGSDVVIARRKDDNYWRCWGYKLTVNFSYTGREIGCRTFNRANFAKILKAAGVKTKGKTNGKK